jgi:hypothetical protein
VAGRRNPTFLKRQKEQKRMEKASAKRAARQQRRADRAAGIKDEAVIEEEPLGPVDEENPTS